MKCLAGTALELLPPGVIVIFQLGINGDRLLFPLIQLFILLGQDIVLDLLGHIIQDG